MKWIGQHIYDLIARFRNDVYLENLAERTQDQIIGIDVTGTNTNVPGTNTLYTSELSVGDEIVVSGETRTIATITGDTTATVTAAWGSDLANDTSPDCNPTALVDVTII